MNIDFAGRDVDLRRGKRISLRRKGIFCLLGGLIFLLQGLFYLNDTVTGLILLVLEVIYGVVFAVDHSTEQEGNSFMRKATRFLVELAGLLIVFILAVLVWIWLWRMTGLALAFLSAATFALIGFILVGWSYAPVRSR